MTSEKIAIPVRATLLAALAIVAALRVFVWTGNVFEFARETWIYTGAFVATQLVVVFLLRPKRVLEAFASVSVAALGFKYLLAPFFYEPFRSFKVYLYFLLIYAVIAGLVGPRADLRVRPRRRFSIAFAVVVAFTLIAKPSGFQDAYPHLAQSVRNKLFYSGDALPYALAPVFAQEFDQPVALAQDPKDPSTLLVVERAGRLKTVSLRPPETPATLVLDVSGSVGDLLEERGMANAVFHPTEPYLFVVYTARLPDGRSMNRLSRFDVSRDGGKLAVARESELVMIDQNDQHEYHNGGGLAFGPDGFLYVGVGDEGGSNDKFSNSQAIDKSLFSGILRLDVDRRGGAVSRAPKKQPVDGVTQGYFVPLDNPFVGDPTALDEFYAIGLRNPFRMSFDAQGRFWVADVGQNNFEELDLVEKGDNLQWAFKEGPAQNNDSRFKGQPPAKVHGRSKDPLFFYRHSGASVCVIGGVMHKGKYVFADLAGEVYELTLDGNEVKSFDLVAVVHGIGLGIGGLFPVDGEIYLALIGGYGGSRGQIVKLVPRGTAGAIAAAPSDGQAVSIDEKYALFCARCHGPEGKPAPGAADKPRDFTDAAWQATVTDEWLIEVVRDGGAAAGLSATMPSWKGVLNDKETKEMVGKVRRFGASR